MDWVIQLTLTHLGVLCAVEAFALGNCHKSLSHHRNSTPVLTVFIKLNWVKLFLIQRQLFPTSFFLSTHPQWSCENACYNVCDDKEGHCNVRCIHLPRKQGCRWSGLLIQICQNDIFPLICLVSWFQTNGSSVSHNKTCNKNMLCCFIWDTSNVTVHV